MAGCYDASGKSVNLQTVEYFQPLSYINVVYRLISHFYIIINLKIGQVTSAQAKFLSVWVSLPQQWKVTFSKMFYSIRYPGNLLHKNKNDM